MLSLRFLINVCQKSHEDTGIKFTCVQADCRHSVSSAEVSCRLQEIKDDLEKALRLMESERPGNGDHVYV